MRALKHTLPTIRDYSKQYVISWVARDDPASRPWAQ